MIAAFLVLVAPPAGAQYGGSPQLIVDPVRVPIDGEFDTFGQDCPAGSTVTITIDGFPQVLASGIAGSDGVFLIPDVPMPAGVVAGTDYNVRAACGGESAIFVITAVCNDGADPIDGTCEFGNTVGGGSDPDPTTTTTAGGNDNGGGNNGGGNNGGGNGGDGTNLALTGTDALQLWAMIGSTLIAAGFALVLLTARRRNEEVSGGGGA